MATTFALACYRDLDDATRAWAKRYFVCSGRVPNDNQAALYSSVLHFLEAVKKVDGEEALAVAEPMKPPRSTTSPRTENRGYGRVIYDRHLMKQKQPSGLKGPGTTST